MNEYDAAKAIKAISKARAKMILDFPFFSALALRLQVVVAPELVETCGVDGRHLWINPDFINAQRPDHLVTIVAHEAMHCALHHHLRRGARDPHRSNIAQDYAINLLLKASGFPMPSHALIDQKYADMAWEQIYPLIPEQPPSMSLVLMPDYGGMGCVIDAKGDDGKPLPEAERDALERDWKVFGTSQPETGFRASIPR
jgi:hypothetical protein